MIEYVRLSARASGPISEPRGAHMVCPLKKCPVKKDEEMTQGGKAINCLPVACGTG